MIKDHDDMDELISLVLLMPRVMMGKGGPPPMAPDLMPTPHQIMAAEIILETPGIAMGELAAKLHMSTSSATQLIDRLMPTGFIERFDDPDDRRVVRLKTSEFGAVKMRGMKEMMCHRMREVFSCLSQADVKELVRIHRIVLDNLERTEKQ